MQFEENNDPEPQQPKIAIYSKWAVLFFSVFFSPVVGSVLVMLNLRRIGRKTEGFMVLIFGIIYMIIAAIVLVKMLGLPIDKVTPQMLLANPKVIYYSKALDILGGAILAEFFFRRYFQGDDYESRSIWAPLLIMIALSFLLGPMM